MQVFSSDDEKQAEIEPVDIESPEDTEGVAITTVDDVDDGEDLDIVTIGGESTTPEDAEESTTPKWVKDLREEHKQLKREKRELAEKLKTLEAKPEAVDTLGEKPRLSDFDYDEDSFDFALTQWHERKREHDKKSELAADEARKIEEQWAGKISHYEGGKKQLKVKDFADAEEAAHEVLNVTQQGIIIDVAKNPALVMYAVGKNKAELERLSKISNPLHFAIAVHQLEQKLSVTKKTAPPPETRVTGSGRTAGSVDSTLEKLRADAEKTGDFTKVIAYKKQLKKG